MSIRRLAQGGLIDRTQPLDFSWDGYACRGYAGDTLASALLANNQRVLGRSFKYHRPRGVMSAGVEESGAIVTLGQGARREPNVKATLQPLYQGLVASGQNAWPSVRTDVGAINGWFSRFLAAGFYYKTFMGWPPRGTGVWMQYEKLIRKAAGMGTASREPDPDVYDHGHDHCDLLVVGGGPSGLSAAREAAAAGLDVLLVEQDTHWGGDLLNRAEPAKQALREQLIAAARLAGVRMKRQTTCFGLYDHAVAGLLERVNDSALAASPEQPRQIFWTVRARQIIVAAGAIERLSAFGNNDLPGVMSANAGRSYLNRYALQLGQQVAIATNNDSAYAVALELAASGASVSLYEARQAEQADPESIEQLRAAGVAFQAGSSFLKASGSYRLKRMDLAAVGPDSRHHRAIGHCACDLALVSAGWSPVVNLVAHRGVAPRWEADQACFVADEFAEPIQVIGAAAARWRTEDCLQAGEVAGARAAEALGAGSARRSVSMPAKGGWRAPIKPLYEVRVPGWRLSSFVDPQHDVTSDDIRLAQQEGFVSVEHLKRYTTLGMATDGGKMGNVIGLALMAEALGKSIPEVGTTRFRPPYTPVALGALSGRNVGEHFRPLRRTALHDWHLAHGATMTEAGLWQRPWYYAREGETLEQAYIREAATVRQ